jgi:hypothetical protein
MPVNIIEFVKVKVPSGSEFVGKTVAVNLVEVEDDLGYRYVGTPEGVVKVRTKIECDLGDQCTQGKIDEEFKTHPKIIEFDDEGKGPGEFIKDLAEVVIASDYKGDKLVFCCYECSAKAFRKMGRNSNVVEITAGKGYKSAVKGSAVLDDKSEGTEPSN